MNFINKVYRHLLWRVRHTSKITFPQIFLSYFLPKRVMTGPFAGMKYLQKSVGSVVLPKLVGTYENELNIVFEKIRQKNYDCFIDIGAAEGFYAVGVKKFLLPQTENTIAFEATEKGRNLVEKLADLNNVENIIVKGFCDLNALSAVLPKNKNVFILVDIEGGEYELLNPKLLDFSNCDLLVEVHYISKEKRENELIQKFSGTHNITPIYKGEKRLPEKVNWHPIIRKYGAYAVNEFRGNQSQSWLFLESKKRA